MLGLRERLGTLARMRRGMAVTRGKGLLALFIVFLLLLGGSLAYFKPEYAQAALVGIGAFTLLFGLMVLGKIKISSG